MSVIRADNVAPSAGGTAKSLVRGVASAWANLNGTGTIILRDSQNVSSVVDDGIGAYTYNLANTLAANNGSGYGTGRQSGNLILGSFSPDLASASSVKINNFNSSTLGAVDVTYSLFGIFGDLA